MVGREDKHCLRTNIKALAPSSTVGAAGTKHTVTQSNVHIKTHTLYSRQKASRFLPPSPCLSIAAFPPSTARGTMGTIRDVTTPWKPGDPPLINTTLKLQGLLPSYLWFPRLKPVCFEGRHATCQTTLLTGLCVPTRGAVQYKKLFSS